MTDRELWKAGVVEFRARCAALSPDVRQALSNLVWRLQACKIALQEITHGVDGGSVCAACGGDCCVAGKYHFTVADLLVYFVAGESLFEPRFGQGMCPYLGDKACLMGPKFRPYNCITFNCDGIEGLLTRAEQVRFVAYTAELIKLYDEMTVLLKTPVRQGLLLWSERVLEPATNQLDKEGR